MDAATVDHSAFGREQLLRKAEARTPEQLDETIGSALNQVTPIDARGWFASCGYNIF